ncbi:MAG: DUF4199 domain-containing protein [Bacteroidales bacterium]|nr:DUF4199 domain-containing protein [Bacteroidales bacterium]
MEEKSTLKFKVSLVNGIILGLALIVFSVLLYIFDLNLKSYMNWFNYLIIVGIVVYATKTYRDNNLNGYMTYGQALGLGTLILVFGVLISNIYNYIFMTVIDPDYLSKMLVMIEEKLLEKGMSDDQIEMVLSMQRKMLTPLIASLSDFAGKSIFGFIIILITSAFLKKEGDPYQEAMQDIEE